MNTPTVPVFYRTMPPPGEERDRLIAIELKVDIEQKEKHDWVTDNSGKIDDVVWDSNGHHGPVCKRCHYAPCTMCLSLEEESIKEGPCNPPIPSYSTSTNICDELVAAVARRGYQIETVTFAFKEEIRTAACVLSMKHLRRKGIEITALTRADAISAAVLMTLWEDGQNV